jgi:hypothetical protein
MGRLVRSSYTLKSPYWSPDMAALPPVTGCRYVVVQLWCQSLGQRCLFKAIHGPSSHLALPRFAHIPSAAFLYTLPAGFASRNGNDIKINAYFMDTVFRKLIDSKSSITGSVCNLQAKLSSSKDEES